MIVRTAKITRKIIEAAPKLKIMSRHGAGYDMVDIEACKEKGILVCTAGGANAVSVAEIAIFNMLYCAKKFKAVQTGGPSGGCLPESLLDTPVDYDNLIAAGSMMGSGGMIVMDEDNCMVDIARFYLDFIVDEPCGKCTPCRVGTKRMLEILNRIVNGKGKEGDIEKLEELAKTIKSTALCGLGQTAPNPVLSTLHFFRDEYEAHIKEKRCPAHHCKALLQYVITDKCRGCTACARVCPAQAISGEVKKQHVIDPDKCLKCGACMEKCRFGAITKM